MEKVRSIVGIDLTYSDDDSNSCNNITIMPNMIDLNFDYKNTNLFVSGGYLFKEDSFKNIKIKIKELKGDCYFVSKETINAIKSFLHDEKCDKVALEIKYAGIQSVYDNNNSITIYSKRKNLIILELTEEDKKNGFVLSFMFTK